jgi:hypothetical protein
MTYYAGFAPLMIRDHNEEVLKEVKKLRLKNQLRENHQPRSGHAFAFILERLKPLPRKARVAT